MRATMRTLPLARYACVCVYVCTTRICATHRHRVSRGTLRRPSYMESRASEYMRAWETTEGNNTRVSACVRARARMRRETNDCTARRFFISRRSAILRCKLHHTLFSVLHSKQYFNKFVHQFLDIYCFRGLFLFWIHSGLLLSDLFTEIYRFVCAIFCLWDVI